MALIAALFPTSMGCADVPYRTTIKGATASDLANLLDQISQLKALEDRPPPSEEALPRRAESDLGRLADAAHSLGYWFVCSAPTASRFSLMPAEAGGEQGSPRRWKSEREPLYEALMHVQRAHSSMDYPSPPAKARLHSNRSGVRPLDSRFRGNDE